MLVSDLLTAAIRSIGVVAADETPSTSELNDALYAANDILSSWSPEIVPVTPLVKEQFVSTAAASYTIGTGGIFNTARPVKIEALACISSVGGRAPVRMITAEEWAATVDTTATGLFAERAWYDGGYPLATLWLLPIPVNTSKIEITSYKPLAAFVNLSDTVNLMPGYTNALRWALAFEMAPEFGRPVTQELAALAANAKGRITGLNIAVLGKPNTIEPMNPAIPPAPTG